MNINENNNGIVLAAAWFNAVMGTIFNEHLLSSVAYISSIVGSAVYIYTTIKKHKEK